MLFQREVTDDLIMAELDKKKMKLLIPPKSTGVAKPSVYGKASARAPVGSKIDTGLHKDKKFTPSAAPTTLGKENKTVSTSSAARKQLKVGTHYCNVIAEWYIVARTLDTDPD